MTTIYYFVIASTGMSGQQMQFPAFYYLYKIFSIGKFIIRNIISLGNHTS